MMVRLLQLKKAIVEYFRKHEANDRKLSSREWTITNEVCSLLDVVAEVTVKIQGATDTHISQMMFNMKEIREIFNGVDHNIRVADQSYKKDSVEKEKIAVEDLMEESRKVRDVVLSRIAKKGLGEASMRLERICALLDPRRKECSLEHLINGTEEVKADAIDDVKSVAKTFAETDDASASSSGGGGGAGGEDSNQPPPKKQKVLSDLDERRLQRVAKAKAASAGRAPAAGNRAAKRSANILRELRMYLAEDPAPEEDDFSLLGFWMRRSKPRTCVETNEVEAGLPHLALIARLYHGIESTSCQADRNFSALAFLIGSLRSTMLPGKVERIMFLRLNRLFIPEVKALDDAIQANKAAAARCKEKVADIEAATAGDAVVLTL